MNLTTGCFLRILKDLPTGWAFSFRNPDSGCKSTKFEGAQKLITETPPYPTPICHPHQSDDHEVSPFIPLIHFQRVVNLLERW